MGTKGGPQPGSGRPKGKKASHTLMAQSARIRLIEMYKLASEQINLVLIKKALDGDMMAIRELHERVFGKPFTSEEADDANALNNQLQLSDDQYKQAIQAAASRSGGPQSST